MRVSFLFKNSDRLLNAMDDLKITERRDIHNLNKQKQAIVNNLYDVYVNMYDMLKLKYEFPLNIERLIHISQPSERQLHILKNAMLNVVNNRD